MSYFINLLLTYYSNYKDNRYCLILPIGTYICLHEKDFYCRGSGAFATRADRIVQELTEKENAEDFCANADKAMSYIPHEVSYTPK